MTDPVLSLLADMLDPPEWMPEGRPELKPHQRPPDGDWFLWLLFGGRGAGKTEGGAQYFARYMRRNPGHRGAIVGPTLGDVIEACVRGTSGLLAQDPAIKFHTPPGGAMLTWPNGSEAILIGTPTPRDVDRLRAQGNRHILWLEEFAANPQAPTIWDEQVPHVVRLGHRPHVIATTTPRPRKIIRNLVASPRTVVTRGTVFDNPGIEDSVKEAMRKHYEGTRIGRQELYGELIEDVEGAIWQSAWIEETRRPAPETMDRVVVSIDPAVTANEDSDETGIVVCGFSTQEQRGYVLADLSMRDTPNVWGRAAVRAFHTWQADHIVAEKNNGGDLIKTHLAQIDPSVPVMLVHASRGKITRAEPVAMLYEQGRISHTEVFPELEEQMTSYTGDTGDASPDRMDALVWALWDLMIRGGRGTVTRTAMWEPEPVVRIPGGPTLKGRKYVDKDPRG